MNAKVWINGAWTDPCDGHSLPVIDPGTGDVFARIADGQADDVDRAVAAARAAMRGAWGATTAAERGRMLSRLGRLVQRHEDELTELESRDCGKLTATARSDVRSLARYFEFYGGAADKLHGETIPYQNDYVVSVVRQPFGVSAHIIPWNYPVQIFGRSVGASLAVGNAAVVKPAEDACLSVLRLGELAAEAGLPPGALNIVPGLGETAGAALIAHPGVDFISFTGSPQTGTLVQQAAAVNHVPCTLELGGKSPQVVFPDADLTRAIPAIVNGIIQNAGQTCSAGARLLVHHDCYGQVIEAMTDTFRALRTGPQTGDVDCGPIINQRQQQRILDFIDTAVSGGLDITAQGELPADLPPGGYYVPPTLFASVPRDHVLAREEVFGPVLVAMPFEDEADAIALANDTAYGLVAGVWTADGSRQQRLAQAIDSGQVFVNCYGAGGGVELPFGGFGRSGHGREKGFAALRDMSQAKTVVQYIAS